MKLKPFYTYSEVARLERRSLDTLKGWITTDRKLPTDERRFPHAFGGTIPLADLKARYDMSNDDIAALDCDVDDDDDTAEAAS